MDLSQIISIAGKPGLFKIINQSRNGVIVTSLTDGKKMAIGQTQRVSALSDISVYTFEGDVLLGEIFKSMYEKTGGGPVVIALKEDDVVRDFFTEVLPDHDEERVYHSDIRKIIKWFNLLLDKGLLSFEEEKSEESEAPEADEKPAEEGEAKKADEGKDADRE